MNTMMTNAQTLLKQLPSILILSVLACISCTTTAPLSDEQATQSSSRQDSTSTEAGERLSPPQQATPDSSLNRLRTSRTKDNSTIDRSRIIPILKDRKRFYEAQASSQQGDQKGRPSILFHDYNDELVVTYGIDSLDTLTLLSQETYEELGLTRRELRALVVENLKTVLPRPVVRTGQLYSMIAAGKRYESSLLLLDDFWKGLSLGRDEIVVAIPTRHVLLFTEANNKQGIAALRKLAAQIKKQSANGLTDALLVYRDGKFVRFD